jgi:carbamoyl-phosphate synthase/aspartate carbamoyltransferase
MQIDTVLPGFSAFMDYLHITFNAVEHVINFQDRGLMALGASMRRIGFVVEFD